MTYYAVLDIVRPFCFEHYVAAKINKKIIKKDPGENLGVNRLNSEAYPDKEIVFCFQLVMEGE